MSCEEKHQILATMEMLIPGGGGIVELGALASDSCAMEGADAARRLNNATAFCLVREIC